MQRDKNRIVVPNQELSAIELAAMKRPSKDGSMAPRIIRCFIEYVSATYGIDIGVDTEEMANERSKQEIKVDRKHALLSRKLARKSSGSDFDDF